MYIIALHIRIYDGILRKDVATYMQVFNFRYMDDKISTCTFSTYSDSTLIVLDLVALLCVKLYS